MACAIVYQLMDSIDTKAIEMVIAKPHESVLDEEPPDPSAPRSVEVNSVTPWRSITAGVIRREVTQVIARRPKVVVDHIENDCEPARMTFVHQSFESIRVSVGRVRRIQVDA